MQERWAVNVLRIMHYKALFPDVKFTCYKSVCHSSCVKTSEIASVVRVRVCQDLLNGRVLSRLHLLFFLTSFSYQNLLFTEEQKIYFNVQKHLRKCFWNIRDPENRTHVLWDQIQRELCEQLSLHRSSEVWLFSRSNIPSLMLRSSLVVMSLWCVVLCVRMFKASSWVFLMCMRVITELSFFHLSKFHLEVC